MKETDIKQLASKMKQLKRNNSSTILFIGAGASVTAGIPLAEDIMKYIENNEDLKDFICDCPKRTYPKYMECLSSNDRKKLFQEYISRAKINPAHYYASQLVAQDYVDCIVTTNFDPLMLRTLAQYYNIIPSVYDLAIARETVTTDYDYPAIIYLHGQAHGFWQLNTEDELDLPKKTISDTFSKISINRTWIVVGYSGNDPVLEHLVSVGNFGENLYWVGYEKNDPIDNVKERLLDKQVKGSQLIRGYNSDSFFLALRNQLKLDEPEIFSKPFTYLLNKLETINPIIKDNTTLDLFTKTKNQIHIAIKGFEQRHGFEELKAHTKEDIEREELLQKIKEIFNNDDFDGLKVIEGKIDKLQDEKILEYYSYSLNNFGIHLYKSAQQKEGEEAEKLFRESFKKYQKVVEIKKDFNEAYSNWGNALSVLASKKEGEEAEKLSKESFEKYQRAVEIKKDDSGTFYNWGIAISELASRKEGEDAEKLFKESIEKYQRAIEIKKDFHNAYNNWGLTLSEFAKRKDGEESEKLFIESIEKFKKAVELRRDFSKAYNNWGVAISEMAKQKGKGESEKLFIESIEKYQIAIDFKKDYSNAYNNWGLALYELAKQKGGEESEKLLIESIEKFKKAVELKKNYSEVYNNWGLALSELAKQKKGEESEKLYLESFGKYQKAVELKQNDNEVYNNWGLALSELAKQKKGEESEKLYMESIEKFKKAVELKQNDNEANNNWGVALSELAKQKKGKEYNELLNIALEKCLKAEEIKRGSGAYNIACFKSLLDNLEESIKWLEVALISSNVTREHIEKDTDLDNVRSDQRFIFLLDTYRPLKKS